MLHLCCVELPAHSGNTRNLWYSALTAGLVVFRTKRLLNESNILIYLKKVGSGGGT